MKWIAVTLTALMGAVASAIAPDQRDFMFEGATYRMVVFDPARGEFSPQVILSPRLVPVRTLLGEEKPVAAITGTFFAWENGQPVGEVVINGDTQTAGARGSVLAVDWLGRVSIFDAPVRGWTDYFPYRFALRATIRVTRDGVIDPRPWDQGFRDRSLWGSAARTCVGTTPGGKLVMAATRNSVTLSGLGRAMASQGVNNLVALDGGGSTMLFANGRSLIGTMRPLNNLFVVYDRSPLDDEYRAHLARLARNQTDGVASGASGRLGSSR
ncbi:MAG: phosphodiester glycosidase family protein [Fimbriimonadaceae bacterium]|nr:phosphodiester glycosidase family protein [Fimbriimonadaceae bacterium]